nr:leucine zipper domain-containing protein [Paenarthrobacter nicotinovorans]
MSHSNAILASAGRLKLARCVVDARLPLRRAAERFNVSVPTAARWAGRFVESGEAGMLDRPSRPLSCPHGSSDQDRQQRRPHHGPTPPLDHAPAPPNQRPPDTSGAEPAPPVPPPTTRQNRHRELRSTTPPWLRP